MLKRICLFLFTMLVFSVYALDVDEGEIKSYGKTIEFINYEGPHSIVESSANIQNIGQGLGQAIMRGAKSAGEIGRYYIIHAVDSSVKIGLEADILIIGEGSKVDHIKNLRRIISGYLQGAYKYPQKDADTLAIFITIYNAAYRGNIEYFTSKYKGVVVKELSPNKAGLAIRWDEWAGRSQIVIPLSTVRGAKSGSIDTGAISDSSTIKSLKEEKADSAAGDRMALVDIKERGQEQEKAAIEAEKQRIAKEEEALAAKKTQLAEDKATAAAGTKPDGTATTKPDGTADKGGQQTASVESAAKAKQDEAKIAASEEQIKKDKAELAAREEAAAKKDEEIAADRAAIAKDQKDEIKKEVAAAASGGGVVLFQLMDTAVPLYRIVLYDLAGKKALTRSDINTLRASTIIDDGNAFLASAGQFTGAGGAVRLVRIDKADYKKVIQGGTDLFPDTLLWKYGTSIYAVCKKDSAWVIGRFDKLSLELKATSEAVSPNTFLSEVQGKLVAQKVDGAFITLNMESLATE